MNILGTLFSAGTGSVIDAVGKATDGLFTSDEERGQIELEQERIELERAKLADRAAERQVEVNLAEAEHKSTFVAGARPFILWGCGVGVWYHFIIYPIIGPFVWKYFSVQLHELDWQQLSVLLGGMLGFGGYRTYEKMKGVATHALSPKK